MTAAEDEHRRRHEKMEEDLQDLVVDHAGLREKFAQLMGAVKDLVVAVRGDGNGSRGAIPRLNAMEYMLNTMAKTVSRQGVRMKAHAARLDAIENEATELRELIETQKKNADSLKSEFTQLLSRFEADLDMTKELKTQFERQVDTGQMAIQEKSKFRMALIELLKHAVTAGVAMLASKYGLPSFPPK
jgi:chromosome segregation ATPase